MRHSYSWIKGAAGSRQWTPLLAAVLLARGEHGLAPGRVARSLGVPMVIGCHPEPVTGPHPVDGDWIAAIDGSTGEAALLRAGAVEGVPCLARRAG